MRMIGLGNVTVVKPLRELGTKSPRLGEAFLTSAISEGLPLFA